MFKVYLYGSLGRRYGREFEFYVSDAAEALRALCSQMKGLRERLQKGFYKVQIDKQYSTEETIGADLHRKGTQVLKITPSVKGAGGEDSGPLMLIAGIVILAFMWWNPFGWAAASMVMTMGTSLGMGLVMGGLQQMLTTLPKNQGNEEGKSTSFSNLDNMGAQGAAIPIIYGDIRVGSLVLSQGLESYSVMDGTNVVTPTGWVTEGDDYKTVLKREEEIRAEVERAAYEEYRANVASRHYLDSDRRGNALNWHEIRRPEPPAKKLF